MMKWLFVALSLLLITGANSNLLNLLRSYDHDYYHSCDYLVIGSGGGSVTAGKLAEGLRNKKICLVERGSDYLESPLRSKVELVDNLVELSRERYFAEGIKSVLQPTLINSTTYGPREFEDVVGNGTGGGGSVNSMGYRRPQRWVFDEINKPGWSYSEVLPSLLEIESRVPIMQMTQNYSNIQELMALAFSKSGYPYQPAPLDNIVGHWQSYWTSKFLPNGTLVRTSAYISYVTPNVINAPRGNTLVVFPEIKIHRLIVLPGLLKHNVIGAIGKDQSSGKLVIFGVSKRVIVAAGVYRTPQLLMLSGIGPRQALLSNGIYPLKDLPVGQNFWYHTNLQTIHLPNPQFIEGFDQTTNRKNNMFGSGPIGKAKDEWIIGLSTIFIREFFPNSPIGFSEIITTNVSSRGVITINSTNANDNPVIDHRVFTHPADIDAVKRTFREFRRVMSQQEGQTAYVMELAPGAAVPTDDDFLVEMYIRSAAGIAHIGGGCHIGSVVDPKLKVLGTKNLHICDMSVYPSPVGVNAYSTAMLAGHQCAKFILEEDA
ncbi:Glucose-methanol-choline oxidoreductase [Orpheovirus IHUMI-LCC2]|uniref:Glucose-methanol-choline oxidoreductase n=1 Tax=Orpheovirus IHUMI-LCC2 TaxID=2023057 RepID=A0A2I2L4M9_9VIRU|nr:Glucose-methanol-choline oxidoreductase [Orpheovirus IHUMI-LCC2]SNW62484.1 Glucose-methanol-choline oxidoreductase [Orpheovirus IHUMI-LCC2]